jgi:benzoate-CoA ligase
MPDFDPGGRPPALRFGLAMTFPERYNLVDHFVDRHLREARGNKVAIVCGVSQVTYRELSGHVSQVAHALRSLGVEEEQRVMLVLPDSVEFAAAYLGTMKLGAVAVPTSTALRAADYAYFLEESRARVLVVHSSLLAEVGGALGGQRCLRHVIVCGEPQRDHVHWDDWLRGRPTEFAAAPTCPDEVAFWLWTSGSTGRPKAAVHLQRDWWYCAEQYARGVLDIRESDVVFSSSKLFHAYGLGNSLMFPLHVGATTVLYPARAQAQPILQTAQASGATLFFSVPTLYAAMLQEAERCADYELKRVRLAVSAAEPLPADIYRRWRERFGIEILDGIGSTEVLHMYMSARAGNVRPGSSGQSVPGYQLRIVDAAGQDVPPGTIGDLLVSGESTALYYWNRRQLTAERMLGRWFVTGDKYYVDAEGFHWYAGRSDDMFRVSGQWVSPAEVESALIEHPSVLESAVVAFEEETKLCTPKAFVVLKDGYAGGPELVRELQAFVRQRITPYKYPRRIEFLSELPKSAAGKLLRYKLRERDSPLKGTGALGGQSP